MSLRIVDPLATSTSLSVLCLWLLSIVRLLNIVCVKRSDVFSLRAEERDLSTAALVAGYTRKSFHMVIVSLVIHFLASENCLIQEPMGS